MKRRTFLKFSGAAIAAPLVFAAKEGNPKAEPIKPIEDLTDFAIPQRSVEIRGLVPGMAVGVWYADTMEEVIAPIVCDGDTVTVWVEDPEPQYTPTFLIRGRKGGYLPFQCEAQLSEKGLVVHVVCVKDTLWGGSV